MRMFALVVACVASSPVLAQVRVHISLPTIRFEQPPALVEIEPGVQVVGDWDDEVFVVDGAYWHRRNGRWFRSADHSGHWVMTEQRSVPVRLVTYAPGTYRHWRTVRVAEPVRERHEEKHRDERRHDEKHH